MSPFTFMHANQLRCEIDRTMFVMVDPNFQVFHIRRSGTAGATAVDFGVPSVGGDVKPIQIAKSLATTLLGHFEVCRGRVFACSKSAPYNGSELVKELQRAVSWRGWGDLVAEAAVVSLKEAFGIVWAALARAGRQTDV